MSRWRFGLMIVLAMSIAAPAVACMWDSDTLAREAGGLPGVVEIITGRFERNPPRYYTMRLERVSKIIENDPTDLAAYDDAGVACDRLGRHDDAIAWMDKKKTQLDIADANDPNVREHLYRYHANLGTFYAHRWLANGAMRDDMSDMERGVEHITKAIEINPDAHFGREKYQLLAMKWILNPPVDPEHGGIPSDFSSIYDAIKPADGGPATLPGAGYQYLNTAEYQDAIEGISGLIALGNAWNSYDIQIALGIALQMDNHASVAYLAGLRCTEIREQGGETFYPLPDESEFENAEQYDIYLEQVYMSHGGGMGRMGVGSQQTEEIETFFTAARAEADDWHERRTQYMLTRLERGEHPDTHANFWNDFGPGAPPAMPSGYFGYTGETAMVLKSLTGLAIAFVTGVAALIYWTNKRRKRLAPEYAVAQTQTL